jgi:hypothetical protein
VPAGSRFVSSGLFPLHEKRRVSTLQESQPVPDVFRCSEQAKTELLSRVPIHEGAMLSDELLQREREAAKPCNERVAILVRRSMRQEEFLQSAPEVRKTFIPPAIDDGLNIIIFDPAAPPQRIRVEGSDYRVNLIEKTTPGYLDEGAPDSGVVKLAVVIGKDGMVIDIDPLAGPEPLISSAVDAVRRSKYEPTLLNGRPVEIETTVDVAFSLNQ